MESYTYKETGYVPKFEDFEDFEKEEDKQLTKG